MTPSLITGKAYVLGDNVDTDQIIPAHHLTLNPSLPEEYRQFGKHALSGVPASLSGLPRGHVPFHTSDEYVCDFAIVVAGKNFGCGSSREQATAAIYYAGVGAVIAVSFARIFLRNSINLGLPVVVSPEAAERAAEGAELEIDLTGGAITNRTTGEMYSAARLDARAVEYLEAGGLVPYLKKKYAAAG